MERYHLMGREYVHFDDAQAALDAKEARIKELEEEVELQKRTNLQGEEYVASQWRDHSDELQQQLDAVLAEAVWAMEILRDDWEPESFIGRNAAAFLARPDVQAWQKRQEAGQ